MKLRTDYGLNVTLKKRVWKCEKHTRVCVYVPGVVTYHTLSLIGCGSVLPGFLWGVCGGDCSSLWLADPQQQLF